MIEEDFKDRFDIIDFIIKCLQEHEKKLDDLIYSLEQKLEQPTNRGLTFNQALNIVTAFTYAILPASLDETDTRVAIQVFVHDLNRRKLIPKDWVDRLIECVIERREMICG